jgi:Fur family ferric uptake transcriptional regulator
MAHRPHPPDQGAAALGPRQPTLLSLLREADAELSGQALHERLKGGSESHGLATHLIGVSCGLSRVLLRGGKLLFPIFEVHGLCSSCQQSEPLAHG